MKPDLNLLVVLDALCRLGSVSRAAETLALSQPAISHALNRLRAATNDPLFTRSGRGLVPTPRAMELSGQVAGLVAVGRACLEPDAFDPAGQGRRFRIGISDYAGLTLLPRLVVALQREAPASSIEAAPVSSGVLRQLAEGTLDLSFWGAAAPAPPFDYQPLFRESFVAVLKRGHPALAGGTDLSLDAFVGLGHAVVSLGDPGQSPVDLALAGLGLSRRVVLSSPGFAANIASVVESDLVATVPARLTRVLPETLVACRLPFEVPGFSYGLIWHPRVEAAPPQRWLRSLIVRVAGLAEVPG